MNRTITRLAVIEHGEPAVRILNAVHDLATDVTSITTLLIHGGDSEPPWYGREADEVVAIDGPLGGARSTTIVAALEVNGVDAVWIGEIPDRLDLVDACAEVGIEVVGADADIIRRSAILRGMTGDGGAPIEPLRRIEVDVLADDHGNLWCAGGRDVSVRDGERTLIAEAPCAAIDDEFAGELRRGTVDAATTIGHRGAAVVTFVHDGHRYRLEEFDATATPVHATTEERTGVTVIGNRIRAARGESLDGDAPRGAGVVFGASLYADDPDPGAPIDDDGDVIAELGFPSGAGVRVDASRRPGDPVDDPLLAVVTVWGPDRSTALSRLCRALERTSVVLTRRGTNRCALLAALRHPDMVANRIDESWFDRHRDELRAAAPVPIALVAAAIEAYETDRALAQDAFLASAARGRPEQSSRVGARIELAYAGHVYELSVDRTGLDVYQVHHGRITVVVAVERLGKYDRRLNLGGRRHRLLAAPTGSGWRIEFDGGEHLIDREDGSVLRSGWPALVVDVLVAPGDVLAAGDPVVVLESMKMETTVTAPFAGEVTAVDVAANARIERGAPLLRVRQERRAQRTGAHDVVSLDAFEARSDTTRKACQRVYGALGQYLLGFDLAPAELHRLLVQQRRFAEIAEPGDVDLIACEDSLLDVYADLCALNRPRAAPGPDDEEGDVEPEGTEGYLASFLQWLDADRAGLPDTYRDRLGRVLERYGVDGLQRSAELEQAMTWLFRSFLRLDEMTGIVIAILERRLQHRRALVPALGADVGARLDRLAASTQGRQQVIADLARDVRFHFFDEPPMEAAAAALMREMAAHFDALATDPGRADRNGRMARLVGCPHPLRSEMLRQWRLGEEASPAHAARRRDAVLEVDIRRYYRARDLGPIVHHDIDGFRFASTDYAIDGKEIHLVVSFLALDDLCSFVNVIREHGRTVAAERRLVLDLVAWRHDVTPDAATLAAIVADMLDDCDWGRRVHRLSVTVTSAEGPQDEHLRTHVVTFRQRDDDEWFEEEVLRNLHPMLAKRMELWRLDNFALERRPSPEDVYLFVGQAHDNAADRRLFALAEVRELDAAIDAVTGDVHYPRLERTGLLALASMRTELSRFSPRERPVANRLVLDIGPTWTLPDDDLQTLIRRFAPLARRAGLEKVILKVKVPDPERSAGVRPAVLHFEEVGGSVLARQDAAGDQPVKTISPYRQKVLTAARFGAPYPYEIARVLTRGRSDDTFVELDLEVGDQQADGESHDVLVPVDRAPGLNSAHLVVGLITNRTDRIPEGIQRIALLSDPTRGLGNLAEPECRRVNAALAYALEHRIPVEWFAVSSGALISMDSGTENMDWIALTLRRLIEFTQAGGEINVVVTGINVGGQPYWNAEATMLTHTKGILVMNPASTMVLTGKQALDFSGAVSAEDNHGIGGYERVMGPNGQAQYYAASFTDACHILRRYYELTYVVPGERFPRRRPTDDPDDRDVRDSTHDEVPGSPFRTVGDVFSAELNPERKLPFDMRSVMRSVSDRDLDPLERWRDLRDGETSIVWDTTVGGIPVCMLGIESHTVRRQGFVPSDGPPAWTSGTLFPHSSRKIARAINSASARRPLVVLANLSGFDGSPESMRRRQLEYGAEIGRAITNFDGPIVFVVVSRYHGGAFVVFSKALNESMEIAAVEGSFASVIGGAPAAATVFAREVRNRTQADERVRRATEASASASGAEASALRARLVDVTSTVRSEKLGEVAWEFDGVHTIERARRVGSVDHIVPAERLRPFVIEALERGMARC